MLHLPDANMGRGARRDPADGESLLCRDGKLSLLLEKGVWAFAGGGKKPVSSPSQRRITIRCILLLPHLIPA